jgi:hypothetical protein
MRQLELLCGSWVRELCAVKPPSFVSDHNENFLIGHTTAIYVNTLVRVFVITVNDAVGQGFSQSDFHVNFVSRNTLAFLNEDHELVDEG